LGAGKLTPKIARQQLAILEQQLAAALHEGIPRETLARRYYLPMFEAAMSLSDLNRAQSLRQKVPEKDLQAGDIIKWWRKNFWLDYLLHRLNQAESWANKLSKWADKTGDELLKANALHYLGMIAEKRRDFEKAEDWYKKSLKIFEQLGDEHSAATTYWQLGYLGLLQGRVEDFGRWFVKSIAAFSKTRDQDRANQVTNIFRIAYQEASQSEQRKLKQCWENAGLGPLPDAAAGE
jgi:tetratricopeptide (TPR) repeat protein